jgi:hypothetical protein
LDIDGEDDIISTGDNLRHFYVDPSDHGSIKGIVTLPDNEQALSLVKKVIKFLGQEYYLTIKEEMILHGCHTYSLPSPLFNSSWMITH